MAIDSLGSITSSTPIHKQLLSSLPLLAKDGIYLNTDFSKDLGSRALYFGTGLCTTRMMSVGIPFDFIGLVITAEIIRRICGFDRIIHLIADSHAKSNHFVSDAEVDTKARLFRELALRVANRLGLRGTYEVLLASEIDSSPEYIAILESIPAGGSHEYTRREWADMEYLARHRSVSLKLSWKMPLKKEKSHRLDETFFDEGFSAHFPRPYSFIYVRAALTFDPARLNVCPYTTVPEEKRLLLQADENAETKLTEFCAVKHKAIDRALEQINAIVKMFEQMVGTTLPGSTLGERVNSVIRIILS